VLGLAWIGMSGAALAAEHQMRLRTESEGGRFRFDPPLLFAAPGDEIRFVPDNHLHAVKSIAGMLPRGVQPWRGRMGETMSVRLEAPGVYGLKCAAHYQIGMVALIVVGSEPTNWRNARAVRHPPPPTEALNELFAAAACHFGPILAQECDRSVDSAQYEAPDLR
jgi:pseudoazurin